MTDVAVACCWASPDPPPDRLHPDPDAAPLQEALAGAGFRSELVAWDDPRPDWGSFAAVLLSSTWDSVDRPGEFLAWAAAAAAVTRLVNPVRVLTWAMDKCYLRDLGAVGVPVIPTVWVGPDDAWDGRPDTEVVVKPSVSAGGRRTARYRAGDPAAVDHVRSLQAAGHTAMVQPYLGEIESSGETDLTFVDGAFSHAVGKNPMLRAGGAVGERPWEDMSWSGLVAPDAAQRTVAAHAMDAVAARVGGQPLFARVDLVPDASGRPVVLEVELIDPYLSLDLAPGGAVALAAGLHRSIRAPAPVSEASAPAGTQHEDPLHHAGGEA